ncbi:hypothetical protein DFH29DRAFT_1007848 [Suillus ampliporus]|nr:hypothetical protein DFH29DRAFT_1007848 [Suillus ampliporus]
MSRHHRQSDCKELLMMYVSSVLVDSQLPAFGFSNSYEDPTPAVTQHQVIYGGDPTIGDQTLAPADLHDASLFQRDISGTRSSNCVNVPVLMEIDSFNSAAGPPSHDVSSNYFYHAVSDYASASLSGSNLDDSWPITSIQATHHQFQEEVHPCPEYPVKADASELHGSGCVFVCEWHDGHVSCGETINEGEIVGNVSSYHLKPAHVSHLLKCQWEGCQLSEPIRRDTHIREIHFRIKHRCKRWVASRLRGSRKNARPY